jgi:hypothetical protein
VDVKEAILEGRNVNWDTLRGKKDVLVLLAQQPPFDVDVTQILLVQCREPI